jgi:hypothetical protein
VRKFCLQLVEARLSKPSRTIPYDAGHCAADAIFRVSVFRDQVFHALCDVCIRASHRQKLVYLVARDCVEELEIFGVGSGGRVFGGGREEKLVSNRGSEADNLDAVGLTQVFLSYRASCDTSCMLSVLALSP